jgi:LytS/YehU family sensor histidine kinase
MNPHFLFNSLNSIKHFIIKNKQKEAVTYLTKFAKLIRMVLETSKLQEVSLKEEIDLMNIYIDVENMRFNNAIDYRVTIDKDISMSDYKVPPMILQAFYENAIWHGLAPKKGKKQLSLSINKEAPFIKIVIEDNGIGRKKAEIISLQKNIYLQKESMGLKLTEERLKMYTQAYKNKSKIEYIDLYDAQENAIGTKIVISIPFA